MKKRMGEGRGPFFEGEERLFVILVQGVGADYSVGAYLRKYGIL